jgi:tetratricopeptide (TPR) repeat protein
VIEMRQQATLYDTLGVERDASESEIRQAFRRLAMEHHPDRFKDSKRIAAEERFQVITEAFNVLSHPDSREKYDMEISAGTDIKAMDAKEISRRLAAKGSQSLRAGNIAEAVEHLKMAIDHDENNSRAHYFYGRVLARIPGKERDALRHVERATILEPNNATMLAEVAVLAVTAGMKTRAIRFAKEALAADPDNVKARGILDEIEGQGAKGGSLLGRLRGRS